MTSQDQTLDAIKRQGKINVGASIFQDRHVSHWPHTFAGFPVDPNMVFDVVHHKAVGERKEYYECVAYGFGLIDNPPAYGNGSIFAHGVNPITFID